MSYVESGDEQSEDGELRQSPPDASARPKNNTMDFRLVFKTLVQRHGIHSNNYYCSLSEDEGDNVDSLDIKPPQARISQNSRNKRREAHETRSHHKRSDRHRDERAAHSHRDKHHR